MQQASHSLSAPLVPCFLFHLDLLTLVGLWSSLKLLLSQSGPAVRPLAVVPQHPTRTALTWLKGSQKNCSCSWHFSIRETARERQECDDSIDTRQRDRNLVCWELAVCLCLGKLQPLRARSPEVLPGAEGHSGLTRAKVALWKNTCCTTPNVADCMPQSTPPSPACHASSPPLSKLSSKMLPAACLTTEGVTSAQRLSCHRQH